MYLGFVSLYWWNIYITWSCLPHITCKGTVIRCKCSCKAYLDFSPTISINTNKKKDKIAGRSPGLYRTIAWEVKKYFTSNCTNLHGKMCYEVDEHPPILEESKQRRQMFEKRQNGAAFEKWNEASSILELFQ